MRCYLQLLPVVLYIAISCMTREADAFATTTTTISNHFSYKQQYPTSALSAQRWCHGIVARNDAFSSSTCNAKQISQSSRSSSRFSTTVISNAAVSNLMDPVVLRAGMGATAKLLSSIALGAAAASKRVGVLDADAIKALSRLTFSVFQPAFLLASVSRTFVGASKGTGLPGQYLALMPVMAALQITLGALVGNLICRCGFLGKNSSKSEQSQVKICATFGNSGPLPLIFSEALFAGSSISIFRDVAACISFYLLVWSPLFWSVGRMILGTYNSGSAINGQEPTAVAKIKDEVKKFLSPPVIGSILGVFIGTIPVLRSAFFGGIATPLFGAIATLGTAYLPAALLVLAGSLVGGGSKVKVAEESSGVVAAAKKSTPSLRSIAAIFMTRFLVAPSLSFASLSVLSRMGLLGAAGSRARAIITFCILAEGW